MAKLEIDGIAITNHNLFDLAQFNKITNNIEIKVFPCIEINLETGHLLLISENNELEDFDSKCKQVENLVKEKNDFISVEVLKHIFCDLSKYLLIPHYEKNPIITKEVLAELHPHIFAGEVSSTRKFKSCSLDKDKSTPVIFSDVRICVDMQPYPTRQTFFF